MQVGTTVTQYIIEEQRNAPGATGDFTSLINDIVIASKAIADAVNRGSLAGVLGSAGTGNVQGEEQKKLDVIANELFLHCNQWRGHVAGMASEEMDGVYRIPECYPRGKYLLLFDPLDGSSNIDVNGSIGTIFSVLRCPEGVDNPTEADFMQPGSQQVCAGYVFYGPSTMLVMTIGHGTHGFTLDRSVGEFILTHPDMRIPQDSKEFSINMSNRRHWETPVLRYIEECEAGKSGPRGKDFGMRYVGAMVADVHRVMCRGGIFLYPTDIKLKAKGQAGKLRLMYEANPIAFLVEQAGGLATTGYEPILQIQPTSLHQRCAVILGSYHEVARITDYHRSAD